MRLGSSAPLVPLPKSGLSAAAERGAASFLLQGAPCCAHSLTLGGWKWGCEAELMERIFPAPKLAAPRARLEPPLRGDGGLHSNGKWGGKAANGPKAAGLGEEAPKGEEGGVASVSPPCHLAVLKLKLAPFPCPALGVWFYHNHCGGLGGEKGGGCGVLYDGLQWV